MFARDKIISGSVLALSALWVPAAQAEKATGNLQVKVQISSSCILSSGANSLLDFGTFATISDTYHFAQTDVSGGIEVSCAQGIPYTIGLGGGLNPADNYNTSFIRRMKSGAEYINYYLFTSATHSAHWLDGTVGGSSNVVRGTGNGSVQKYPVFGKLAQQATPPAGAYTDTVVIEVNY